MALILKVVRNGAAPVPDSCASEAKLPPNAEVQVRRLVFECWSQPLFCEDKLKEMRHKQNFSRERVFGRTHHYLRGEKQVWYIKNNLEPARQEMNDI